MSMGWRISPAILAVYHMKRIINGMYDADCAQLCRIVERRAICSPRESFGEILGNLDLGSGKEPKAAIVRAPGRVRTALRVCLPA